MAVLVNLFGSRMLLQVERESEDDELSDGQKMAKMIITWKKMMMQGVTKESEEDDVDGESNEFDDNEEENESGDEGDDDNKYAAKEELEKEQELRSQEQ